LKVLNRLLVDPREPDPAAIEQAVAILRAGGIVAYPTDTLYGLAVDPRSDSAVRKLYAAKERDRSAAITLIAADLAQAKRAGAFGPREIRLAETFWPGPLTIIVHAEETLSRWVCSDLGTVGVRVPAHAVARALAAGFGGCVTATSANLSGRAAATTADETAAAVGGRIDAVLDAGPAPGGAPSTIVEVTDVGPVLRRAGAVAWDRVLKSLE
jgi:L-threonylcarbamoyladenylate synthase